MYGSSFYKHGARERLQNCYFAAVVGAMIYLIPTYLLPIYIRMFILRIGSGAAAMTAVNIIDIILAVFVTEIFLVGFIRMLMNIQPLGESNARKCDYNLLLSGFTMRYGNTLKITFLKNLKIILWSLIMFIPTAVAAVAAFLLIDAEVIEHIVMMYGEVLTNPTNTGILELSKYINDNLPYLGIASLLYLGATAAASVPVIYKRFEYAAITYIVAEDPDVPCKRAFRMTKNIMHGFRMRYFLIGLSFILYFMLMGMVVVVYGSPVVMFLGQALLMPYMYMTYLEFYRQRKSVIDYNISTYGENAE